MDFWEIDILEKLWGIIMLSMKITSLKTIPEVETSHNKDIKKKVMIAKGSMPLVTQIAQVVFKPGQIAEKHIHDDMFETFYIEQGEGIVAIDDTNVALEKGMCVTVEPGEAHEVKNTGKEELVVLVFGLKNP